MDDETIKSLQEENARLRKMICSKEPHRIKIKVLVSFGNIDQLDDLIAKVKKIRETHYDVEIEVDFRALELGANSEEDQAVE